MMSASTRWMGAGDASLRYGETAAEVTLRQAATALLALFFSTHGFIPGVFSATDLRSVAGSQDSTLLGLAVEAIAWGMAAFLMVGHARAMLRAVMRLRWTGLLVLLALLSAAWSQAPAMTLRKGFLLCFTTLFGVYLAVGFDWEKQLRIVVWALVSAAVFSVVVAVALPAYGIDHLSQYGARAGAWQGIFSQKNICARAMAYGALGMSAWMQVRQRIHWSQVTGWMVCLLVLAMTRSLTGVVLTAMLLAAAWAIPRLARLDLAARTALLAGLGISVIAIVMLALPHAADIERWMGRSPTLTGRLAVWEAVAGAIGKHVVLGYGYQAFWQGLRGESANVVLAAGWFVPAAHNGFLEIWLQLGGVGLALFVLSLLRNGRLLWRAIKSSAGYAEADLGSTIWPCSVVLLTVFYNLDESSALLYNDLMWVVYVAVTLGLECREANAWQV